LQQFQKLNSLSKADAKGNKAISETAQIFSGLVDKVGEILFPDVPKFSEATENGRVN